MHFNKLVGALAVAICVCIVGMGAKPFDAQFKLIKIENECKVKVAGTSGFVAAKVGSDYPYGTTILTGRKSSAVISFSDGNECRILARTELVVMEDTKDRKMKTLKLAMGKAEIDLQPDFHKDNDLKVETPTAICGAVECHFTAEVLSGRGFIRAIFESLKGIIKIDGEGFNVPVVGAGATLMISGSYDLDEIVVTVVKGELKVNVKEGQDKSKLFTLPQGSTIRIRRTVVDDKTERITVTITMPDGKVVTFSYTQTAKPRKGRGTIFTPVNETGSSTSTTQSRNLDLQVPADAPPVYPTPTQVGNV